MVILISDSVIPSLWISEFMTINMFSSVKRIPVALAMLLIFISWFYFNYFILL